MLALFTSFCQSNVDLQTFVKTGNASNTQIGIRIRTKTGTLQYQGVTFNILYQSSNASPLSLDDSRIATAFNWGTTSRFTNPNQPVGVSLGGQTYDRRYVYGNSDETAGSNLITLTTSWDTLLYISFNNLQSSFPQGGYAYAQSTNQSPTVALTDINFSNVPLDVSSGPVALGPVALPVEFTKFDAQCSEQGTSLAWSTAVEKDNSYFDVQKSTDGAAWTSLGRVAGNSSHTYQFTDKAGGQATYRIKQVDGSGAFSYTDVVRTTCNSQAFFVSLYPIPARDKVTLVVTSDKALNTTVELVDNYGRVVMRLPVVINKGTNHFPLDVSRLSQGQYYLRSSQEGPAINQRLTISR